MYIGGSLQERTMPESRLVVCHCCLLVLDQYRAVKQLSQLLLRMKYKRFDGHGKDLTGNQGLTDIDPIALFQV